MTTSTSRDSLDATLAHSQLFERSNGRVYIAHYALPRETAPRMRHKFVFERILSSLKFH